MIGKSGDTYGAKRLLQILAVLFFASSVGCGAANHISVFIFSRFVGGLAIGGASVLCPVYISEISPPKHRGILTATFQLAIVIGILMSLISNYLLMNIGDQNWRWMLYSGAFPAVAFFLMLLVIRKSPRWLVPRGRLDEARTVLQRCGSDTGNVEDEILEIQHSMDLTHHSLKEPW